VTHVEVKNSSTIFAGILKGNTCFGVSAKMNRKGILFQRLDST
jgi:hypothetical protein